MDPEEDVVLSNDASRAHCSTQSVDCPSHTSPSPVILRVSPAQAREQFGYIHLTSGEHKHQETIRAYFDSAGREVITLPCPNFERNFFLQTLSALAMSPFCVTYLNISYAWDAGFLKTPPTPVMAALTFRGYPAHPLQFRHPCYLGDTPDLLLVQPM